jgi:hypothetical protein
MTAQRCDPNLLDHVKSFAGNILTSRISFSSSKTIWSMLMKHFFIVEKNPVGQKRLKQGSSMVEVLKLIPRQLALLPHLSLLLESSGCWFFA